MCCGCCSDAVAPEPRIVHDVFTVAEMGETESSDILIVGSREFIQRVNFVALKTLRLSVKIVTSAVEANRALQKEFFVSYDPETGEENLSNPTNFRLVVVDLSFNGIRDVRRAYSAYKRDKGKEIPFLAYTCKLNKKVKKILVQQGFNEVIFYKSSDEYISLDSKVVVYFQPSQPSEEEEERSRIADLSYSGLM